MVMQVKGMGMGQDMGQWVVLEASGDMVTALLVTLYLGMLVQLTVMATVLLVMVSVDTVVAMMEFVDMVTTLVDTTVPIDKRVVMVVGMEDTFWVEGILMVGTVVLPQWMAVTQLRLPHTYKEWGIMRVPMMHTDLALDWLQVQESQEQVLLMEVCSVADMQDMVPIQVVVLLEVSEVLVDMQDMVPIQVVVLLEVSE